MPIFKTPWFVRGLAVVAICSAGGAAAYAADSVNVFDLPFGTRGGNREPFVTIGESVTRSDVTITLDSIHYSSSRTTFDFSIRGIDAKLGKHALGVLFHPGSLKYTGLEDSEPVLEGQGPILGVEKKRVQLGAVKVAGSPISLEIGRLLVLSPEDEKFIIDGPWKFTVLPPLTAIDPVDIDVELTGDADIGGQHVWLDRLHLSSSGLQVYYELDAEGGYLGEAGFAARLILPDGRWLPGLSPSGQDTLTTGARRVDFEELPAGIVTARLALGPYLRRIDGPFLFSVPLPGRPASLPATVPLGRRFEVAGESVEFASLHVEEGRFGLELVNVNAERRTVVPDLESEIDLTDDLGNDYSTSEVSWKHGEDAFGANVADRAIVWFHEPLHPDATQLTLTAPTVARIESGPEFTVALTGN